MSEKLSERYIINLLNQVPGVAENSGVGPPLSTVLLSVREELSSNGKNNKLPGSSDTRNSQGNPKLEIQLTPPDQP